MPISPSFSGALVGLGAAAAHAALSGAVSPRLPRAMRPPDFVPDVVVRWAKARLGHAGALSPGQVQRLVLLLHLGYGALLGALYARSPLPDHLPAAVGGPLFGFAAWAIGFEGWIPALGILPRTTAHPPARWIAPILGHTAFGSALALAYGFSRKLAWRTRGPG